MVTTTIKKCIAIAIAMLATSSLFAYDFFADGLFYNINSDGTTVTVRRSDLQRWLDQGLRNPR